MFYATLYFILYYLIILIGWLLIKLMRFLYRLGLSDEEKAALQLNKPAPWKRKVFIGLSWMLLPALPYAVVETQTKLFGAQFIPLVKQIERGNNGSESPISSMKILKYFGNTAEVYYVTPCTNDLNHTSGETSYSVTVHRRNGKWVAGDDWDAVWSDCASANENTFPPYR